MNNVQKSLLVEAQKHVESDPIYAKELLVEALQALKPVDREYQCARLYEPPGSCAPY